jgi:peptidoglycan/LPS O-acetylase OafA/YrhL
VLAGLGLNAMYVVFILIGMAFHYAYQRRWGQLESALIGAALFGLWIVGISNGGIGGTPLADVYLPTSTLALIVFGGLYLVRNGLPYWVWLDRLSNISYPLYLLHGVNGYITIRAVYTLTGNYYVSLIAALAVVVLVATAVHHFVEVPTNNFGRQVSRRLQRRRQRSVSAPMPDSSESDSTQVLVAPEVQAPLP